MNEAFWPLFGSFLVALVTAALVTIALVAATVRFTRRLSYRVDDIEDRLASLRGKSAANKRWDKESWMDEALAHQPAAPVPRYDNDPR